METPAWTPHFNQLEIWVMNMDHKLFGPDAQHVTPETLRLGGFDEMVKCLAIALPDATIRAFWADALVSVDTQELTRWMKHIERPSPSEQNIAMLLWPNIKAAAEAQHQTTPSSFEEAVAGEIEATTAGTTYEGTTPGILVGRGKPTGATVSSFLQLLQPRNPVGAIVDSRGAELRFIASRPLTPAAQAQTGVLIVGGRQGISEVIQDELNSVFMAMSVPLLKVSLAPKEQTAHTSLAFLRLQEDAGRLKAAMADLQQLGPEGYRKMLSAAEDAWFGAFPAITAQNVKTKQKQPQAAVNDLPENGSLSQKRKGTPVVATMPVFRKVAAEAVKDLQRSDPTIKYKWWDYCDSHGKGLYDPFRHTLVFLQNFLSEVNAIPAPPGLDSGGGDTKKKEMQGNAAPKGASRKAVAPNANSEDNILLNAIKMAGLDDKLPPGLQQKDFLQEVQQALLQAEAGNGPSFSSRMDVSRFTQAGYSKMNPRLSHPAHVMTAPELPPIQEWMGHPACKSRSMDLPPASSAGLEQSGVPVDLDDSSDSRSRESSADFRNDMAMSSFPATGSWPADLPSPWPTEPVFGERERAHANGMDMPGLNGQNPGMAALLAKFAQRSGPVSAPEGWRQDLWNSQPDARPRARREGAGPPQPVFANGPFGNSREQQYAMQQQQQQRGKYNTYPGDYAAEHGYSEQPHRGRSGNAQPVGPTSQSSNRGQFRSQLEVLNTVLERISPNEQNGQASRAGANGQEQLLARLLAGLSGGQTHGEDQSFAQAMEQVRALDMANARGPRPLSQTDVSSLWDAPRGPPQNEVSMPFDGAGGKGGGRQQMPFPNFSRDAARGHPAACWTTGQLPDLSSEFESETF